VDVIFMEARVSLVHREKVPVGEQRFFDAVVHSRGEVNGPFIALGNSSQDLMARVARLGAYHRGLGEGGTSQLSARVRTFTAIITVRSLNGVFEWAAWTSHARRAGVPEDFIDAVRARERPSGMTEEDEIVFDVVSQLVSESHRLEKDTYESAYRHFGPLGIVELITCIGYFSLLAIPLNTFEIQPANPNAEILKY
jgi:4-carboxymuconolactone decarboxylase